MKSMKVLSALGLLAMAGVAQAEVTGSATLVSNYVWRGATQTDDEAAIQVALNYAHESGFYAGVWGSNVSWTKPAGNVEVDFTAGWATELPMGLKLDFGLTGYVYPGLSEVNTYEGFAKATYSIVTVGLYYTPDYFNADDIDPDLGGEGIYLSADAAIPLPNTPLSLTAHVGNSSGDGVKATFGSSYTDYGLGVSYAADKFTLGMQYIGASDLGTDTVVMSVGMAF